MNHPKFTKGQKVHGSFMGACVVTHPHPDDFNMIGVRSADEDRVYWIVDQNNLEPTLHVHTIETSWRSPEAGEFVVCRQSGKLGVRQAGSNETVPCYVITDVFQKETP